jgi:hypothetical protein
MLDVEIEVSDAESPALPRSARDAQRWRKAVARRKLEILREHRYLRRQLTDVWDETDDA